MSLSTFLLNPSASTSKKKKKDTTDALRLDNDLDALFRASTSSAASKRPSNVKAQVEEAGQSQVHDASAEHDKHLTKRKRSNAHPVEEPPSGENTPAPHKKTHRERSLDATREPKRDKRRKVRDLEPASDEDDAALEESYVAKRAPPPEPTASQQAISEESEEGGEGEAGPSNLVHESVTNAAKKKSKGVRAHKPKFVPDNETVEQRDARTVFVGNVPAEVAKSRPLLKRLKQHLLSFIPTAKIESIRLRSVPFQKPTAPLPTSDDEGPSSKKPAGAKSERQGRQHDADRAATWRQSNQDEEDKPVKKYLDPKEKKRVAFIKGELNPNADSLVAYAVFAHPAQATSESSIPAHSSMDPFEAAAQVVLLCNATIFMEHTLRVDHVRTGKGGPAGGSSVVEGDSKSTLFVGNLDFASKEEDLRVFFEGLISSERGPPTTEADSEQRSPSWVTSVRVVRDRDTQLGKGFAYVQFTDRQCVDEILALEAGQVKFAKRKLRVQRCKATTGPQANDRKGKASDSKFPTSKPPPKAHKDKVPLVPVVVPKGDPLLGEKLAKLSKDERKEFKSADEARVQRRLAKKKARLAMEKSLGAKDKERVRKRTGARRVLELREGGEQRVEDKK